MTLPVEEMVSSRERWTMLTLRCMAIAIAVMAFIDPSITSARRSRPEVSLVVDGNAPNARLVQSVEKALERDYTIVHAAQPSASATVVVGQRLPPTATELAAPVFIALPDSAATAVTIEEVRAPTASSLETRAPVDVTTRITGAKGRTVEFTLSTDGLVVDRISRQVTTADARIDVPLGFVPSAVGVAPLRVVARLVGVSDSASADVAIDVRQRPWAILFFDRRPSWMSTFVRRSLEGDRRFAVASRVVTSKNVSTDAGKPPSSLEDPTLLELYDAIVVGAPDAITDRDVAGLEAFLRRRAGGVVLLFDEPPKSGAAYERLTNVRQWSTTAVSASQIVSAVNTESAGLRGAELVWPTSLPAGSAVMAQTAATTSASGAAAVPKPIVWRTSVGAGQLVVSGALDAWRFRDASTSGFDQFWRSVVAGIADDAIPSIEVRAAESVVRPGEMIDLTVRLRDPMIADPSRPVSASVGAAMEVTGGKRQAVQLWPDGVGSFTGRIRAPTAVGPLRLTATAGDARADVPVVVANAVESATPDNREALRAWVGTRGGRMLEVAELRSALRNAVVARPHVETWYPMRSPWWIAPFVLLLGAEWWWRRRQGMA